jgi:hypothetical protein
MFFLSHETNYGFSHQVIYTDGDVEDLTEIELISIMNVHSLPLYALDNCIFRVNERLAHDADIFTNETIFYVLSDDDDSDIE